MNLARANTDLSYVRTPVIWQSYSLDYLRLRFLNKELVSEITVSDHTRKHHVALILEHFRYRLCGQEERLGIEQRAMSAARIFTRPVFVLRELVDSRRLNRIVKTWLSGWTFLKAKSGR